MERVKKSLDNMVRQTALRMARNGACSLCGGALLDYEARQGWKMCSDCFSTKSPTAYLEKMAKAFVPKLYQGCTFDNFTPNIEQGGNRLKLIPLKQAIAADKWKAILINGSPGVGKTHVACACMRLLIEAGHFPKFIQFSMLAAIGPGELRASYRRDPNEKHSILADAVDATYIVLDDFMGGLGEYGKTVQELLYIILDKRDSDGLKTILTSPLMWEGIRSATGEVGNRLSSMLGPHCYTLEGKDCRDLWLREKSQVQDYLPF